MTTKCKGTTKQGEQCPYKHTKGSEYCKVHNKIDKRKKEKEETGIELNEFKRHISGTVTNSEYINDEPHTHLDTPPAICFDTHTELENTIIHTEPKNTIIHTTTNTIVKPTKNKRKKLNEICNGCSRTITKKECFCDKLDYYNENIKSIIKIQKNVRGFITKKYNMSYYISSLVYCEYQINTTTNKALKDVVGDFYEKHIKRVYIYYTKLTITSNYDKCYFGFNPDCCMIDNTMNIKLVTEIKGHYLDSCFMERALVGIVKTIDKFNKENKEIPKFEIHSFTTYKLFNEKIEEFKPIINDKLWSILNDKLIYTTICSQDRLRNQLWFKEGVYRKCYTTNLNYIKIKEHIKFINSIK